MLYLYLFYMITIIYITFPLLIDTDGKVKSGLGEQLMELNQRQPAFIYNKGSPIFI